MSGLFKAKTNTVTQEALLTPEQKQMMTLLSQLGGTGSAGGITLGDQYGGSLGNFDMSGIESMGGNRLMELLNAGTPEGIGTARNTLTGLANNKFNPDDPTSGYAAYQRQVERSAQGVNDNLNRDAAITGDRFSSTLGRQKADLAAQQSDVLASKLAELYNTAQDRSLNASNSLASLENTNENINQNRIGSAFQYGGLERMLKTAEAQAKYGEFQRARTEKLGQFDVAKNLLGQKFEWGVPSVTTKSPSTFMSMFGETNPYVGSYNTHKYGYTTNQSSLAELMKAAMSAAKIAGGMPGGV